MGYFDYEEHIPSTRIDIIRELTEGEWDEMAFDMFLSTVESSAELYAYADMFDWECGFGELRAIVDHPLCTRSTALLIYWRLDPLWWAKYSTIEDVKQYDKQTVKFLKHIEQGLLGNRFLPDDFEYDPLEDTSLIIDEERADRMSQLPAKLRLDIE